jgi:deoxyadenosine/deoxycytidine kinase
MIIIDGQIGVGKTTLAEKLKQRLQIPIFYELGTPVTQIILDNFYNDQNRWSFTSQTHFLINRFQMIKDIENKGANGILDRSIYGDSIFAEVQYEAGYMREEEFFTYKSLLESFLANIKPPQLLIYLDCDVATALTRIKQRNRECEQDISSEYLTKLNSKYLKWYKKYDTSPKLFLETNKINIHDPKDEAYVITLIENKLRDLL